MMDASTVARIGRLTEIDFECDKLMIAIGAKKYDNGHDGRIERWMEEERRISCTKVFKQRDKQPRL